MSFYIHSIKRQSVLNNVADIRVSVGTLSGVKITRAFPEKLWMAANFSKAPKFRVAI